MRSIRHTFHAPGFSASTGTWGKFFAIERRRSVTLDELISSLDKPQAEPLEPHHMFGVMVMLIGLELLAPALLTSSGFFNAALTLLPSFMPQVFAAMALVGGLTMIGGIVLFARGLRLKAQS